MAEEIEAILKKLEEHDQRFDSHDRRFDEISGKLSLHTELIKLIRLETKIK